MFKAFRHAGAMRIRGEYRGGEKCNKIDLSQINLTLSAVCRACVGRGVLKKRNYEMEKLRGEGHPPQFHGKNINVTRTLIE